MEINQLVMFPTSEDIFLPGRVQKEENGKYRVKDIDSDKEELVDSKDLLIIGEKSLSNTNDMTKMEQLHHSLILHNLRQRYLDHQIIYTYIGPMVISINPYAYLPVYGESLIPEYRTKDRDDLPPHLYATAQKAYKSLVEYSESQSVIISGESGAGKTEATKIVLKFLTVASGSSGEGKDLASMILATNPILEAFGNAKTTRNNNSSRFGKFIKITFDGPKISGAQIDNYLLEKTRIVFQAPTERNYHIFYQIVKGATPEDREKYKLKSDPKEYQYLTNGDVVVDGIVDKEWWGETQESFKILGFDDSEIEQIIYLLSSILLIGNIEFEGEEKVKIKDEEILFQFCELMGTAEAPTKQALIERLFKAAGRGTAYTVPLNYQQAIENRDALAKALYFNLFNWLVKKLNVQLKDDKTDSEKSKFIGVLDIYGFEIFERNSLEQFCINYANEKLHQQFNHHMFKAEQEEYTKEGVPWTEIKFKDNQSCIEMIEKPTNGIITLLVEEGKIPKGADEGFLGRLTKQFARNPYFEHHPKEHDQFGVKHFAGLVTYKIESFLKKNKDTLNVDLIKAMKTSKHPILKEFFSDEVVEEEKKDEEEETVNPFAAAKGRARSARPGPKPKAAAAVTRSKVTLTEKFRQDLGILVDTLASSERHYVRCIKPNDIKKPGIIDAKKVMTQLECNGVFETVTLRKNGFSNRMTIERFLDRYFAVVGSNARNSEGINEYLKDYLTPIDGVTQFAIGNSKVFLRDTAIDKLNAKLAQAWEGKATIIQSYIRTYSAKIKYEELLRKNLAAKELQKYVRVYHAMEEFHALKKAYLERVRCATTIQSFTRRLYARNQLAELKHQYTSAAILQKAIRRWSAISLLEVKREEERKRKEEEERKRKEEEERKKREEEERKRKEEEERIRREEEEKKRKEEEERRLKDEAYRKKMEEEERKKREEEERIRKEEERIRKEEEDKRKKEEERIRREEEEVERKRKEEEDKRKKEEERIRREEEAKHDADRKRIEDEKKRIGEEDRKRDGERKKAEENRKKDEEKLRNEDRKREEENKSKELIKADETRLKDEIKHNGRTNNKDIEPIKKEPLKKIETKPEVETKNTFEEPLHKYNNIEDRGRQPNKVSPEYNRDSSNSPPQKPAVRLKRGVSRSSGRKSSYAPLPTLPMNSPRDGTLTRNIRSSSVSQLGLSEAYSVRPLLSVTDTSSGTINLTLPDEDKQNIQEFFSSIGLPVADVFIREAIDLDTMLEWDNPEQELRDLGIMQKGVIFRIVKALRTMKESSDTASLAKPLPSRRSSIMITPRNTHSRKNSLADVSIKNPTNSMPFIPEGPTIKMKISFIQAQIIPRPEAQGWGTSITGNMDLYVRFDVRQKNKKLFKFNTLPCPKTLKPIWKTGESAPSISVSIPEDWEVWYEVWDSSSLGDNKVAEGVWDWKYIQTLRNGYQWVPLTYLGNSSGELRVLIEELDERDLEYKWERDILGEEFECLKFPLLRDKTGPLTATLIRLISDLDTTTAVLYLHSFSDYFFQTELAKNFAEEGYHFYALDFRRYGRSMQLGGRPNWTINFIEYYEELHMAINFIRQVDGIEKLLLLGHGLGGLVATLFSSDHPEGIDGLCLDSPLFTLNKNWDNLAQKSKGGWFSKSDQNSEDSNFSELYHKCLHTSHGGEWNWDLNLKPISGFPVYSGWVEKIKETQKRLSELTISVPTLVMYSQTSAMPTTWSEDLLKVDIIMNSEKVEQASTKLGKYVKSYAVKDGMHDLFLSRKVVREEALMQMFDYFMWLVDEDVASPIAANQSQSKDDVFLVAK